MAETRICVWCNTPIADGAQTMTVGGELLHHEPTAPCILEYAHDSGDVELCFNVAINLIDRALATHGAVPPAGTSGGTERCAGSPAAENIGAFGGKDQTFGICSAPD